MVPRLAPPIGCCFALTLACGAPSPGGTEGDGGSTGTGPSTGDPATSSTGASGTTGGSDSSAPTSEATTSGGASSTGDATTGESSGGSTGGPAGPLRFNHLQALGTHNSYHLSPGALIKELDYTHRPLDEQLGAQGVRQFELDIHFGDPGEPIEVYHLDVLDTGSTCADLVECLGVLKAWSDDHPAHHPLYVLLEFKSGFDDLAAEDRFMTLEDQVLSVWPSERLIVPDQIQGAAGNLRDGIAATGWPPLDELRGKLLLVMHDDQEWRDAYTDGGNSTQGRLLFPDAFGELAAPFAAVHSINDPIADVAKIQAAVDAGHLVRTRADADNAEPSDGDTSRQIAALMSGAHFISTDYPPPMGDKYDYVCEIPGGTPSRCNPRSAPADCTAEAIEDPQAVGP